MGQEIAGITIILMHCRYLYPGWDTERIKQRLSICLFNKAVQRFFDKDTDISVKENRLDCA